MENCVKSEEQVMIVNTEKSINWINFLKALCFFSSILLYVFFGFIQENNVLTFIGQNSKGIYFMSGALPLTISMVSHYVVE